MFIKTKQKIIAKNNILIKSSKQNGAFFQKQINRDITAALSVNTDEQEEEDQFSTVLSPSLPSLNTSHVSFPSSALVQQRIQFPIY
jgi:hypothetical protein